MDLGLVTDATVEEPGLLSDLMNDGNMFWPHNVSEFLSFVILASENHIWDKFYKNVVTCSTVRVGLNMQMCRGEAPLQTTA